MKLKKCPRILRHQPLKPKHGEETSATIEALRHCDPISFESSVKEAKWKEAMNAEIEAIERNDT
ncbi:retrovirus-related pol polyprotein from transposon tnt 1-94 [Gossypium australe]|uniref:Retrovirus-related pol polyprotein from transposon tnt 1-94 n=1 Tax=Gossypium australe TaxID=47621 RepID=A0A5B6WZB0_9ROSI|nr:retrovirus-related pol polyprotein from transposon tnt 1-94 [Gossypium australe]